MKINSKSSNRALEKFFKCDTCGKKSNEVHLLGADEDGENMFQCDKCWNDDNEYEIQLDMGYAHECEGCKSFVNGACERTYLADVFGRCECYEQ